MTKKREHLSMKRLRVLAVEYGESLGKENGYSKFLEAHWFLDFVESQMKSPQGIK